VEISVEKVFTEEILDLAVQQFSLQKERKKLGDFENYVFEVWRKGEPFILRFTHSSHRHKEELLAEIDWMKFLFQCGLNVPNVTPTKNGEIVMTFPAEDGTFFYGSLFSKVPGEQISVRSEKFNQTLFYQWGKTIGRMHHVTKSYKKDINIPTRPQWDEDELLMLEKYIPKEEDLIVANTKELLHELSFLEKNSDQYGLIHTDIHSGNFFYDGTDIHVFDFDDCCYHWFCSDIAIPLYYSALYKFLDGSKEERNAFAGVFLKAFLNGYVTENSLPEDWKRQIPLFLRLRDVTLYSVLHKKIAPEDRDAGIQKELAEIKSRIEKNEAIVEIPSISF
jgi:amicoumacin kinase